MIKYYVFDSMRNLMPIWAYLKKSYTYVVGLYRDGQLVGCHVDSAKNPVSLKQLTQNVFDIFPQDLDELDNYIQRNGERIKYSYEDSVTGYDEEGEAVKNVKQKVKSDPPSPRRGDK
nr:MAG TPA: hypothetical protein [Caudoviricetes sp.]